MKKENIRTSKGELIVRFFSFIKDREVRINFDNMNEMFKAFHKAWKEAQNEGLWLYEILRYCVDNSNYRNEGSVLLGKWFYQKRNVCDQREGSVINRSDIFGLKILFDQYLFEKEGK